jgi:DNA polymerase
MERAHLASIFERPRHGLTPFALRAPDEATRERTYAAIVAALREAGKLAQPLREAGKLAQRDAARESDG